MGNPAGLKAFPLNAHLQLRGFLQRGDMALPFLYVHMHSLLPERRRPVKVFRRNMRNYNGILRSKKVFKAG
jgi:hypothetical protein